MNIYRISQTEVVGWDTFDSAIVIAEDEQEARCTHPSRIYTPPISEWSDDSTWCSSAHAVKVELIGVAAPFSTVGVVCSSFNAG